EPSRNLRTNHRRAGIVHVVSELLAGSQQNLQPVTRAGGGTHGLVGRLTAVVLDTHCHAAALSASAWAASARLTRSTRPGTYCPSSSQPMTRRPSRMAATAVLPEPRKGSST